MSVVKDWLKKNGIHDSDLDKLLQEFGIKNPETDLAALTANQWSELEATIRKQHQSASSASVSNLEQSMATLSKLREDFGSKQSPQPIGTNVSPRNANKRHVTWQEHDDELMFSDDEPDSENARNDFNLPPMAHHESVVDMLMSVDALDPNTAPNSPNAESPALYDYSENIEQPITVTFQTPVVAVSSVTSYPVDSPYGFQALGGLEPMSLPERSLNVEERKEAESLQSILGDDGGDHEEWKEYDDHLRISDDDEPEIDSPSVHETYSLFVPQQVLKTKGSVVDMLMDGPFPKQKAPELGTAISIERAKVEGDGDAKSNERDGSLTTRKATVSLKAESVALDEEEGVLTISLANCKLLHCDAVAGKLTFAVRKDEVNLEDSKGIEKQSRDQIIGSVLDHILKENF